jgi:hypothetical protein
MVGRPVLGSVLRKGRMSLRTSALLRPSLLLLPGSRLPLYALRLRLLPGLLAWLTLLCMLLLCALLSALLLLRLSTPFRKYALVM